jgi:hypothetical protein
LQATVHELPWQTAVPLGSPVQAVQDAPQAVASSSALQPLPQR